MSLSLTNYCRTSSWTCSRFHVVLKLLNSDRFQSVLGHNVVEVRRLMSRERRVCLHSVIMIVVGVVACETLEQADCRQAANRSRSHRRRITETRDETAARLSAQRDRDSQRRRSDDCFELLELSWVLTDIDSTSCETRCTVRTSVERLAVLKTRCSAIAERPRCRVRYSLRQKWKTATGRQYFMDIIGLSSTTVI